MPVSTVSEGSSKPQLALPLHASLLTSLCFFPVGGEGISGREGKSQYSGEISSSIVLAPKGTCIHGSGPRLDDGS